VGLHGRLVAVVESAGRVDVSLNLVSRGDVQGVPLVDMATDEFLRAVMTGLTANFVTARAAARQMCAQGGGVILALDSGSAHGSPMMGSTGPADAALDTFYRNLAMEIGPSGVRVCGIWTAGVPETFTADKLASVNAQMQFDDEQLAALLRQLDAMRMLRRSPSLAQVAAAAAFLASDEAAAITGTWVNVTSGTFAS
jgi:NAD(P)-dependent dehydrogenase (short-subunit alcohol dehydrogenase family)